MAYLSTPLALSSLLLALPASVLSASLPEAQGQPPSDSQNTPPPSATPVSSSSSPAPTANPNDGFSLSTGAIAAIIIFPILAVLLVSVSLWFFCRTRGKALPFHGTRIREIASPNSPTSKDRQAFYGLGSTVEYESIAQLNPVHDQGSQYVPSIRDSWKFGHTRTDTVSSIGSTGSVNHLMSTGLPPSPRLMGRDSRWSGRYTPVSGRESQMSHHTRSRTQGSQSTISLPVHGGGEEERAMSPLAWTAEHIRSDGSDRATPVPWEHRSETERKSSWGPHTPVADRQASGSPDLSVLSPHYDPRINHRMSIPMVFSQPATPVPEEDPNGHHMGLAINLDERSAVHEEPVVESDHRQNRRSRAQTINSVTTIRTSVDTAIGDPQLPSLNELEEMPSLRNNIPMTAIRR